MTLREYLKRHGYTTVGDELYNLVSLWDAWYRGRVADFHNYSIYNSGKRIRRTRATLNMAKQGCEYWANLLWNSECSVTVGDSRAQGIIDNVFSQNDFNRQTNMLMEKVFALGTGAFLVYDTEGGVNIDYITAKYVFPLSYSNKKVESCAFAGIVDNKGVRTMYLMIHEKQKDGSYRIYNKFFEVTDAAGNLKEIPPPDDIKPEYSAGKARFAIITPNIANNAIDVPMGLSVYANSIDILKSIDLAYDGAKTAMELGRPRMGVTSNMVQVDVITGERHDTFDPNDLAVYDLGSAVDDNRVEVKDLTTQYRAADFEGSLERQLLIYSQSIGLGEKAFKWDAASMATATQVISENSAMLRTMEKHQEGLRSAIEQTVIGVLDATGVDSNVEVTVSFDDSITRDKNAERAFDLQLVRDGIMSKVEYRMMHKGEDEATARKMIPEEVADDGINF